MFEKTYIKDGSTIEERLKDIAFAYSSNKEHQTRMEYYLLNQWFLPATPILSNTTKNMVREMEKEHVHLLFCL